MPGLRSWEFTRKWLRRQFLAQTGRRTLTTAGTGAAGPSDCARVEVEPIFPTAEAISGSGGSISCSPALMDGCTAEAMALSGMGMREICGAAASVPWPVEVDALGDWTSIGAPLSEPEFAIAEPSSGRVVGPWCDVASANWGSEAAASQWGAVSHSPPLAARLGMSRQPRPGRQIRRWMQLRRAIDSISRRDRDRKTAEPQAVWKR